MPAASLRESIMDNIVTTIAAITTAGGYNFSVGECILGLKTITDSPGDIMPNVYVAGADEERKNTAQRTYRSDLLVTLVGYVKLADNADKPTLERMISRLIADITKALMVDVTRGGYAITTEINAIDTDKGFYAPFGAVEISVRVDYQAAVATP